MSMRLQALLAEGWKPGSPELPLLSPEMNERACDLVINSIAHHPQNWQAAFIIADLLMNEYDPYPGSSTGIQVDDMARIWPDPEECAAKVNTIHEKFGINYRLTHRQGFKYVRRGAMISLELIRACTQAYAKAMGIPLPEQVRTQIFTKARPYLPEEVILPSPAIPLHDFLCAESELRVQVASRILDDADPIRVRSRQQQLASVALQKH
jgi:hypothetical protein